MQVSRSLALGATVVGLSIVTTAGTSHAEHHAEAQICTLGSAGVGQPGAVICKDVLSGETTQTIPVGPTVSTAGGIAGSLAIRDDRVLVTNQQGGAVLFRLVDGHLKAPQILQTDGEGSLSGVLADNGAYVLTATKLRFFSHGQTTASSVRELLLADGSAAAVTLTNRFAYVSEKNGSLEGFPCSATTAS